MNDITIAEINPDFLTGGKKYYVIRTNGLEKKYFRKDTTLTDNILKAEWYNSYDEASIKLRILSDIKPNIKIKTGPWSILSKIGHIIDDVIVKRYEVLRNLK